MRLIISALLLFSSISASSQTQLIGVFAAKAMIGAFKKEMIPLYSVFDSRITKQDIKRLKKEYKTVSKEIGGDPSNPDLYIKRGHILDTLDVREGARNDFKRAYELGDRRKKMFMALGIINYRFGFFSNSFDSFKNLINHDSLDAEAYLHCGISKLYNVKVFHGVTSSSKEAIPYFERSLKIKPDYKEALILLGYCYSIHNRNNEAIDLFQKAIDTSPKSFSPYLLLCQISLSVKDYSRACLTYEKAKNQGIEIPYKYFKKACGKK